MKRDGDIKERKKERENEERFKRACRVCESVACSLMAIETKDNITIVERKGIDENLWKCNKMSVWRYRDMMQM